MTGMLTSPRAYMVALLVIFGLAMLGVRQIAHAAVAVGPLAVIAVLAAIFGGGLYLENRRREAEGRARYSLGEARELLIPACVLAGVLALAYLFR